MSLDPADDIFDLALAGLAAIAKLTENVIDDNAVAVLHAVRAIVSSFDDHQAGKITYSEAKDAYAKLLKSLDANDAAATAALKARFPNP